MAEPKYDTFAAIRIKNFRFFLSFRFFLTMATQMQSVIVGWQIYSITKDPLTLGLVGLSEAVPYICTSLFGGHIADLLDRKRINLICSIVYFACALSLFKLSNSNLHSYPHPELFFYCIIFITGIARGFIAPSTSALFAQIVPRELYTNAAAWNTNVWQSAAVSGPALGGLIYGWYGVNTAYIIVVGLTALAILSILLVPKYPFEVTIKEEDIFQSINKGIKFVFSNQIILGALTLDLVAVLFGGAVSVLPIFTSEILHSGPQGLGILRAAPFIGSVGMGFFLATRAPMKNAGRNMMFCVAGFGVCMILFALSTNFYLSFLLLFISGVFDNVSVVIRSTILQLMTPNNMRGRVSAVNNIFVGTSNEIGEFESGVAAKLLRLVPSVIIGGSISVIAVIIAYWRAPKLRKLNLQEL